MTGSSWPVISHNTTGKLIHALENFQEHFTCQREHFIKVVPSICLFGHKTNIVRYRMGCAGTHL